MIPTLFGYFFTNPSLHALSFLIIFLKLVPAIFCGEDHCVHQCACVGQYACVVLIELFQSGVGVVQ